MVENQCGNRAINQSNDANDVVNDNIRIDTGDFLCKSLVILWFSFVLFV